MLRAALHSRRAGLRVLRTALLLPAAALLPAASVSEADDSDTALEQANRELVLQMYREFDRGALDGFEPAVSPDFAAHVMGNLSMNWEGFEEFASQFLSAFPDGRHVFDYVVVEGDCVVTVGRYLGTHEGELMGIAPTHREIDLTVMHLDRVVDGKIVEHRGIGNAMHLMTQLGVR